MKRIVLTSAFLTLFAINVFAQAGVDSIAMKKVFGGYVFYQGDQLLKVKQLVTAMKPNEQAYQQIKSAQSTYTMAMILNYAGGFMIGWPLGTAAAGGEANWTLAGIGAGLVVVAIPIGRSFNKKAKQAVDTFNEGLKTSSFWEKSELNFTMTGHGIGLTLNF
ncbi:MAG: hypothetical protein AAF789_00795 [Bacteroidota bacterium]